MAEIKNQSAASDQQFEDALKKAHREWKAAADRSANTKKKFVTVSSAPIDPLYTPAQVTRHGLFPRC